MKKESYIIPEGCKRITVEANEGKLIILFERFEAGEFLNKITGETEQYPGIGDVAIFWDNGSSVSAVIGKCLDWESQQQGLKHQANDGRWYDNAIRFRNGNQYNQILCHESETK